MKKKSFILILITSVTNFIYGQNDCINKVEIKQLGIEFCLPDKNWTFEDEEGLKFITFHKSTLYSGTKTYTLRMEKLNENTTTQKYFDKETTQYSNLEDYKEKIILKGKKTINGKEFLYSKIHAIYKSNNIIRNSYSITYYFVENSIAYSLSLVVSDENIDSWNENEALKIWESFKIVALPENSILD